MADEYHEQLKPGGEPIRELEVANRNYDLIEDATKGMRPKDLEVKYKLSHRQVARILRDAAVQIRTDATDMVAEAYHMQMQRLERLYRLVEMELQRFEQADPGIRVFDDRPFRVAVAIFERQSKLLGMDRGGAVGNKTPNGWIDQAPIEQVVDYARQLKMNVPSEFET